MIIPRQRLCGGQRLLTRRGRAGGAGGAAKHLPGAAVVIAGGRPLREDAIVMTQTALRLLLLVTLLSPLTSAAAAPADNAQVDVVLPEESWTVPPELTFRARVVAITPPEPVDL